jgi:hypothetical protein
VRGGEQGRTDFRPELEFVFRTLVELRVDMDELKREFDVYRHGGPVSLPGETLIGQVGSGSATASLGGGGIELGAYSPSSYSDGFEEVSSAEFRPEARVPDDSVVVFRAGMTMEDLERRAIAAALESVRGNRRKAAEQLGIGERTLYRKIAKYGLDD